MRVNIKQTDGADLGAALCLTAGEAKVMLDAARLSVFIWEGAIDDKVVCAWGLIPPTLLSSQAYLWLYTTEAINEHQFTFVRHSQLVLEKMLCEFETIVGHVTASAPKSIRWLKWLGAKFGEANGTMIPFTIRKKNVRPN